MRQQAVHRMARFPPEPCVLWTVKLTRTAYAQLLGQVFHPPKIFGRWQEREGSPGWRWRDVGMKIVGTSIHAHSRCQPDCAVQACGFEMLYQESKGRTNAVKFEVDGTKTAVYRVLCSVTCR
jgi:SGT1 protein